MTSTAASVFHGLFANTLACTRCTSASVYPAPGPFGPIGGFLGLARHHCASCGRLFWARASARHMRSDETEPEAELRDGLVETPPSEEARALDLDLDLSPREPEPVDLAALDAEFARRCGAPEPRQQHR
jgi:plasmid stability protein